jgi:hypothetical protein
VNIGRLDAVLGCAKISHEKDQCKKQSHHAKGFVVLTICPIKKFFVEERRTAYFISLLI